MEEKDQDWWYCTPGKLAKRPGISGNAKRVWAYLAFRQGGKTRVWSLEKCIAEDLGLKEQCVGSCIKQLEKKGVLIVQRNQVRKGQKRYPVNFYIVTHWDWINLCWDWDR